MAKFNILIGDCDKGYINAISKYLSSCGENDFKVISFTKELFLREYLDTRKADILLISPELMSENLNLFNIQVTIINVEDRIPETLLDYPYINKYQPGDLVAKELINIFSKYSKDEIIGFGSNVKSKVIGVYSPIGGIGKTTTCIGIAKQYALNGFKTLFISLEELASYSALLDCSSTNDFSDLLYYIKQKNKNLILKIEGLKNNDINSGLHYFSPPSCYKDIQEVSVEEWIYLVEYIKTNSSYERIIMDFDSTLSEKNIRLLEVCNEVILLVNTDSISTAKIDRMYSNLEKMSIEDLNNNVNIVFNNINRDNEIMEEVFIRGQKINCYLPYDDNLVNHINGHNNLNLSGYFGRALKNLQS